MKLEFEEVLLIALKDKFVLSPKGSKTHLTFHSGPMTKTFDLHLATTTPEGKQYKTLWVAPHHSLPEVLNGFAKAELLRLLRACRRLNPYLFSRQKVSALVLYHPPEAELALYTKTSKGRVQIDKSRLMEKMWQTDDLNALYECEAHEHFILYRMRVRGKPVRIGSGFKHVDRVGRERLVWLPDHYLSSMIERIRKDMSNELGEFSLESAWFANQRGLVAP